MSIRLAERRLWSVGNAMVDLVAHVPALPRSGGDVRATASIELAGGNGLLALAAAARGGLAVGYAGAHGTGPRGELVRTALRRLGATLALPPVPGMDTGACVVLVEPDGERSFITLPGAESTVAGDDLTALCPGDGDLLHVSGYGRAAQHLAIRALLERLPACVVVLYDPGPAGGAAHPRVDWWSGTLAEAAAALQDTRAEPLDAAARLARRVRAGAVVRLGAAGCIVAAAGAAPVLVPAPRVQTRNTNGAGDTHDGALLAALAAGLTPVAAAERANAAASAAVTHERGAAALLAEPA